MSAKPDRCPTCGQKKRRSTPQSRRLHKLFTEIAANVKAHDGLYHPMPWWKVQFKDRWLGYEEFKRSDGTVIYQLRSEADLNRDEENEFMMKVEMWGIDHGVYLEELEPT